MRRSHTFLTSVLIALGLWQVPTFAVYSCRMDGENHAACCCISQDCASTEADCSCCDVLRVEIKASTSPLSSSAGPGTIPLAWAMYQVRFSDRSLSRSEARPSDLEISAEDLPPPPRIALCIQRI